jgi:hypothetical protein
VETKEKKRRWLLSKLFIWTILLKD